MLGLMQNQPLLISSLLTFAERNHGDGQIVSRRVEPDQDRVALRRRTWKVRRQDRRAAGGSHRCR